ncbi:MAG: respiratory chain complex I subunit 1 family protein [Eggerthellaceae bacterium]|jgi:ech hydrogenase subunit B
MDLYILRIIIGIIAFTILGPIVGCLLAGLDRKVTARMQGRVGPPILQPYYDVRKLIEKDDVSVNSVEGVYVTCALIFTAVAGGIFFAGGNFLLVAFIITLSALFFIMAAYCVRSPYSELGAHRETLQVMCYEPMVLFVAVGLYLATGTFNVDGVFYMHAPIVTTTWGIFLGLLFILAIKLRKSPFDLSYSHHAHQELVKGVTTEMSGKTLAKVEVMHWAENVMFLGWCAMFFVWGGAGSVIVGIIAALVIWFLEIWIDNNFARVKWQVMLKSSWLVALIAGGLNMAILAYL